MSTNRKKFTPPPGGVAGVVDAADVATPEVQEEVLTVNGKPVPAEWAHLINYAMTDQGQAEARARDLATGNKLSGVTVTGDAWDKGLDRMADSEPWDSFNPLSEAVGAVARPGFEYRALSPRVCDKRSLRGWEPVKKENGDLLKVGNLFIGEMPLRKKQRRNDHYRGLSEEAVAQAAANYAADQEKLVRDANVTGLAPLRAGDHVRDSANPDRAIGSVGVSSRRGYEGAEA